MKVNRLIQRAKGYVQANAERLTLAWITPVENGYELSCHLWDGKRASGVWYITTHHSTIEQAEEQIEIVATEYPNRHEDIPVIYNWVDD